jgi:Patatin-like phospholipase
MVPSYAIQLPFEIPGDGLGLLVPWAPYFFKTWKAKGTSIEAGDKPAELDFRLRDVARATSAAPTYFPPALIQNRVGQSFGMIDGGVFPNNPAMCTLVSAYKLFPQANGFMLVSLGTARSKDQFRMPRRKIGASSIGHARPSISYSTATPTRPPTKLVKFSAQCDVPPVVTNSD